VATCPDVETHRSFFLRAEKAEKDLRRLRRRLSRRESGLLERFSHRIAALEGLGYLEGWSLTKRGERLRRVYNELDLLIVEGVERGLLGDLSPAELAGVVSAFTFQPRKDDHREVRMVGRVSDQLHAIDELWRELVVEEKRVGLDPTRQPEPGFAGMAHAWTLGASLEELFGEDDFGAGDFVRNGRQLLDLLRQLRDGFPSIAVVAADAVRAIDRGVVASGGRL